MLGVKNTVQFESSSGSQQTIFKHVSSIATEHIISVILHYMGGYSQEITVTISSQKNRISWLSQAWEISLWNSMTSPGFPWL